MGENVLAAEVREGSGKGAARRLRAAGRIPAVVYGGKGQTRSIHVDPRALEELLRESGSGFNTLIDLEVGGDSDQVLVKELDREPVRGTFLHADFYRIDVTQEVTVDVPLHFVGKAVGIDFGGILDHPVRELEVTCLPTAIPEFVEVDVSGLELNQSLHVSDLVLPEGIEVKTDAALAVAIVSPPAAEEEPEPEAELTEEEAAAAAASAEGEGEGEAPPEESKGDD